jgi:carbamoyltransferase
LYILSFYGGHDASVCLLQAGEIVVHLEIERVTRHKNQRGSEIMHDTRFSGRPWHDRGISWFVDLVLADQGIGWSDISCVALIPDGVRLNRDYAHVPDGVPVYLVNHHVAHASSAFYASPFEEAMVLTLDGGGDDGGGLIAFGSGRALRIARRVPNGAFGLLWDRSLDLWSRSPLGPIGTEGVLMGAAAYGEEIPELRSYFECQVREAWASPEDTYPRMGRVLGDLLPGGRQAHLLPPSFSWQQEESYFAYCHSLQNATDIFFEELFEELAATYDCPALCLAGGVILNCHALGRALGRRPWLRHYVPPAPNDGGLSMGAALWVYHQALGEARRVREEPSSPYLGLRRPDYDYERLFDTVPGLLVERSVTVPALVDRLLAGEVLSLYQGRSESGRRALGNRSIVADPRDPSIRHRINEQIKHRQWYRPFAPAVLQDRVTDVFGQDVDSPYMSVALPVVESWREKVPAVLHRDGTARLQTVSPELNPFFHAIIQEFHARSGVPLVLNTSFNDREPIVETPEDAMHCFLQSGLDALYMEGFLVRRG